MFIEYKDLPTVPKDIIPSLDSIVNGKPYIWRDLTYFNTRKINPDLEEWLKKSMPFEFYSCSFQVMSGKMPIHIDDNKRMVAINYLLCQGGENVFTNIYDKDKITVIQSENIKLNQWHSIQTHKFHNVIDIDTTRISISLSPVDYKKFCGN